MISSHQNPINRSDNDALLQARYAALEVTRHGVKHMPAKALDRNSALELAVSDPLSILHLQCSASDAMLKNAVSHALSASLPAATNDVSYGDQHAILALGPNRWYVLSPYQNGKATGAKLRAMESNKTIAITDVSHAWNVICLNGRHARDVLAKLCSIDLHPSTFKVGSCAQTELRGLYIVLHATNIENFEIFVMRSFLLTIWDWLQDAAAEYRKS